MYHIRVLDQKSHTFRELEQTIMTRELDFKYFIKLTKISTRCRFILHIHIKQNWKSTYRHTGAEQPLGQHMCPRLQS